MKVQNNPLVRKTDLVVQDLNDELLIYDLLTNKAYCLNETTVLIYSLCDGNNPVTEIREKLSKRLKQPVTEDLVWLALEGLKKNNLLENGNELTDYFAGMSRRDVIKRVGYSTIIALPAIFSLVAPPAVMAQSACIEYNQPCSGAGCCPASICAQTVNGFVCTCRCTSPSDCITQTGCPNTRNCNPSRVCAP